MNRIGRAGWVPATVTGAVAALAALLLGGCHAGSEPPPAAGLGDGHRAPGQVCDSFAADRAGEPA